MNPENFTYWLQGYLELSESGQLSEKQVAIIKDHIALTLTKVTPIKHHSFCMSGYSGYSGSGLSGYSGYC